MMKNYLKLHLKSTILHPKILHPTWLLSSFGGVISPSEGEGGLKYLQMDTMITKWHFGKFERTHHPTPHSDLYHQKAYYTHPIFCNFHLSSLNTKCFWLQFCLTLTNLVPELPTLSNFDGVLKVDQKTTTLRRQLWEWKTWEFLQVFTKISNFSPGIENIFGNIAR